MNELTLAFSGDIVPTRRLACPTDAVRAVYDAVDSADLAIGNFEIALTQATTPLAKISNRRADPAVAADIGVLGFDILTVANNHTVDYGWEGLCDTRRALEASGVVVVVILRGPKLPIEKRSVRLLSSTSGSDSDSIGCV